MKTREQILQPLNEAQRKIVTRINGKYAVIAGPGSGKAVTDNTVVQTPNGPFKISDLEIGQDIFGTDGKIYQVEGKYPQGLKEIWEVEFSEGTVIEASEDHFWTFQQRKNRRRNDHGKFIFETMTTKEIYENIDLFKKESSNYNVANVYMPNVLPVEYQEKELSLDPYFLGLLLGGASFKSNTISFSNAEEDIVHKFKDYVEFYGDRLAHMENNDYNIRTIEWRVQNVKTKLGQLNLLDSYSTDKFIPEQYLLSSVDQRLDLLKGLIDTDGYCDGSSYEYSTSSEKLSRNVKTLAQSLGLTAKISIKEKPTYSYKGETREGNTSYRLRIKPSKYFEKLHTSEKHENVWKKGQSSAQVWITDIRPTSREVEMTCISVNSPDKLFLIEDFIPTHNTASMISRAEHLILSGIKPWEILMITFTKKAAGEISERLMSSIGEKAIDIDTGTYHSISLRILLANQALIGYDNNLTVIDEDESFSIISDLSVSHGYSSKEGGQEIKGYIENWQLDGLSPTQVQDLNKYPEDIVLIYQEYQKLKKNIGYIDFNDILNLTVELLEKYPHIREKYAKQYKHIIVDETQDSSPGNLRLVELLSSYHKNFMMVMDDEQSIYGFRGANLEAVLNMLEKYDDLEILKLEQNYRSTKNIVQAANEVINNNTNQLEKEGYSLNKTGAPVFAYDATDEAREAQFVTEVISTLVATGEYTYDDVMILYRSHWKSGAIEAGLNSAGIPYSIVGGTEFYAREDIKNLVSYLRGFDNLNDDLAFQRIINVPKRGVGAKSVDRINVFAAQADLSFFEVLENIEDVPKINKPTKGRILDFVQLIKDGQDMMNEDDASIQEIIYYILKETDYMAQFKPERMSDAERIDLIQTLHGMGADFDMKDKEDLEEGQSIVGQFLTETSLYTPKEEGEEVAPRVQLLTSHASKGLESPIVFIIGLEHGVFPTSRAMTTEAKEEERRLFYVSMTRAEELLFLTHSSRSYAYGRVRNNTPSLFLSEIPDQYVHWLGQKHEDVPF